jgi:hypothetical protein
VTKTPPLVQAKLGAKSSTRFPLSAEAVSGTARIRFSNLRAGSPPRAFRLRSGFPRRSS